MIQSLLIRRSAQRGYVSKGKLNISRTALAAGFVAKPWASAQRLIVLRKSLAANVRLCVAVGLCCAVSSVVCAQGGIASYYMLDVNRQRGGLGSNSVDRYLYDTHFFHRPTVSPLMSLDRFDPIGSTNYHAFVRPERERRELAQQNQRAYVEARRREGRIGETRFNNPQTRGRAPAANPRAAAANARSSGARFNDLGRWYGGR